MLTFWLFLFISSCLQFVFGTPAHTKDIQEIVLKFNIRDQEESYNVIAYQSVKIALEKHTKKNGTGLSLNTRLEWCGNKYALFKNNKTNNVMIIGQLTPEMSGNWSCIINIDKATGFINYRFKMNVVVSNVSASSEDNQSNSVSKSSDRPKPSEVLVGIPIKLTARHDNSEIICTCSRKGFPANILSVTLLLNIFKNQHSANNIALNITTNRHSEVKCLIGNKYIRPPAGTTIFKSVIFEDFSSLFTVFRDTDDSIDRYILKTSNVKGDKLHEETESFVYHHNDKSNDMIDYRSSSGNASMKDFSMGLYGKWIILLLFIIILLSICALLCKSYCYQSKNNLCDNSPNLQEERPPVLLPESSTEESLCDNTEVSKRNQDIYCYVTAPVARFFPEDNVSAGESMYQNKAVYRLHRDENLK